MKTTIKTLCVLIAMLISTTDVSALSTTIELHRQHPIGGQPGPSRSPILETLSLEVSFDDVSKSLCFHDTSNSEVFYYIYNEQNDLECQGICTFDNEGNCTFLLTELSEGTYTLVVSIDGTLYQGEFLIE